MRPTATYISAPTSNTIPYPAQTANTIANTDPNTDAAPLMPHIQGISLVNPAWNIRRMAEGNGTPINTPSPPIPKAATTAGSPSNG